ncbi:hypothetical protein B7494_g2433 [Chlorociboria aeruginascens]|nr:hypothetical protein B7494_g2433 [Chlorociboria aeruginascens]
MKLFIPLLFFTSSALAVWPAPVTFASGNAVLWIKEDITVTYNSNNLPAASASDDVTQLCGKNIVKQAVSRTLSTIFKQGLVPWKLVARHELPEIEPAISYGGTYIKTLAITQTTKDDENTLKPLDGTVDESYNLTITTDGTATIDAVSSVGVLHGLETFSQLFYQHSTGNGVYTNIAPVSIADAPKFAHRGLNMDINRNWYPVADILRTIDALSYNKFNRLHLHITDAQSWPIEIPALPELSDKGSYNPGLTYSPADIQQIQTYAIYRGVEVILEMDMPGHTSSIALAYPELITAYNAQPWSNYCAEPPCGSLKLNDPAVPEFLEKLFDDILPRVKPYSPYFHTGGDEVNANAYLLDPTVNSNDSTVLQPLIQNFTDRNHDQIRAAGLTPIVWEEILLNYNITLGDDVLVQSWLSDQSVANITAAGHKAIAGNYNYWYLDCGKGQWLNFGNGASFDTYYPFKDYCDPFKNWRLVYSYDPLAGVAAENAHLVVGGEVHIWSEQTDPISLDNTVWPRASAAGEVLWSGRQDASLDFIYRAISNNAKHKNYDFWCSLFAAEKSSTVENYIGGLRVLFTCDPENIKAILATQFSDYGKGEPFHEEWSDFLGDSIFTTDLDQWHTSRQLIRPQFIKDRVSDLDTFERHVKILIEEVRKGQGAEIDISDLFFRYTLDAATDFLLGRSVNSLGSPKQEFAEAFGEVQRIQNMIVRAGPFKAFVPRRTFNAGLKIINSFVSTFIDDALRLSPTELSSKSKSEEGYTFLHALASFTRDRKILRDQLVAVLLAGRDTTACTLSWTFYELARHPEIVEKLRQEIIERVGLDRQPSYEDLKGMKFLQNTINETLRLYPVVPFNVRLALKDTTLPHGGGPDGLSPIGILKDTPIGYSSLVMQRRPDLYPASSPTFSNPLVFDPERWYHWQPKPWQYIPFNGGPRICIGQQFALTEMGYTIVRLLQVFDKVENWMARVDGGDPCLKSEIVLQPGQGVRIGMLERTGGKV